MPSTLAVRREPNAIYFHPPANEVVRFNFTLLFKEGRAQRGEVSSLSARKTRDSPSGRVKQTMISSIAKSDDLEEREGRWRGTSQRGG